MTMHDILTLLWRGTLTSSVAIVLVLALRIVVRRWLGAQAAYLLWLLVPAVSLAACMPAARFPIIMLPVVSVAATRAAVSPWIAPALGFDAGVQVSLIVLWLLGMVATMIALLQQQSRFMRSLGALQRQSDGWRSEFTGIGPALVGALRPRIVLPSDFDAHYSARERELVVAHERVHLRRGDAQINALVALLRCLQWFNPLLHFAASRFRFDQEIACDAAVIARFPEARRIYADAMLRAQLTGQVRQELRLPVGCYWQSDHPLKERIMLLKKPIPALARRLGASACIALLIGAASFASWAAQGAGQVPAQAPRIKLGELENIAPSENITYRRMKPPTYPTEAVKAGMGARVILKVLIDQQGQPQSAEVEKVDLIGQPRPAQDGSVADREQYADEFIRVSKVAAMSWKYNAGVKDGNPIAGYVLVPIAFELRDCDDDHPCPPPPAKSSQG